MILIIIVVLLASFLATSLWCHSECNIDVAWVVVVREHFYAIMWKMTMILDDVVTARYEHVVSTTTRDAWKWLDVSWGFFPSPSSRLQELDVAEHWGCNEAQHRPRLLSWTRTTSDESGWSRVKVGELICRIIYCHAFTSHHIFYRCSLKARVHHSFTIEYWYCISSVEHHTGVILL